MTYDPTLGGAVPTLTGAEIVAATRGIDEVADIEVEQWGILLLGSRDPYDVDLEQVFATAGRFGKTVEINGSPHRLDLKDVHARRARDLGLRLAVDTDTHYLSELDNIALGVATARRAWVGPGQVVNTLPLDDLLAWSRAGR